MSENPYQAAVTPLAENTLNLLEPSLKLVQIQLNELNQHAQVLLQQIHNENLNLAETQQCDELLQIFSLIQVYETKLVNIKKEMKNIHERSKKLKKRAIKLQQFKEKSDYIQQQKE